MDLGLIAGEAREEFAKKGRLTASMTLLGQNLKSVKVFEAMLETERAGKAAPGDKLFLDCGHNYISLSIGGGGGQITIGSMWIL